MKHPRQLLLIAGILALLALSCQVVSGLPQAAQTATSTQIVPTQGPPTPTPTELPSIPVQAGEANPNEPVFVSGNIPYTSPFFLNTISEPFVMLEDEAGFVRRDRNFQFSMQEQVIGPVDVHPDNSLTYSLSLPAVPQGTQVDVDNNGKSDTGVQVFAIAYWSNTWGGPFLEKRDGTGWSNAYVSTITDPENNDEITGGTLIVWSPDDKQSFPTGFGADGKLFTADDPTAPIPAGYNIVDLDQKPFHIYKVARPNITLNEGEVAVNDFSGMSYTQAFDALFKKASQEYPFTKEKNIDWQALYDQFAPEVAKASTADDFYRAIHNFTLAIPDAHVGVSVNPDVFYQDAGGSFGLVLKQLSNGDVIASQVLANDPGAEAGIKVGAQILTWNNQPVNEAIDQVVPFFGPYSTEHAKHLDQVTFLTRVPPDTTVNVTFQNPGDSQEQSASMKAVVEYDSLFAADPRFASNEMELPVEGKVLPGSGLGYIRVDTFSGDYNLMAHLWDYYMKQLIDNKVPGLIIDIRNNGGGSGQLALDFAGYFFNKEIPLFESYYYNDRTQKFENSGLPSDITPGTTEYKGPIDVLVSPNCVSACEGFAYALKYDGRSTIVGNYPTAGGFGEVGRGQYKLPEDITLQFPTGKSETADGKVVIEGVGVTPDISVPVTKESVLGNSDTVLEAAVQSLEKEINK